MRLIIGFGTKMYIFEPKLTVVLLKEKDGEAEAEEEEEFEHLPQDPHSTVMAHMEISPEAIGFGASSRRFGFHGSKR
jgi:hypothetical protein